jgi:hypothetical protein
MKANGLRFKVGSFLVRTGLRILGCTRVSLRHVCEPVVIGPIVKYVNDNLPSSVCPPDYKTIESSFTEAEIKWVPK